MPGNATSQSQFTAAKGRDGTYNERQGEAMTRSDTMIPAAAPVAIGA